MVEVVEETNNNSVMRSLSRFVVGIAVSEQSLPSCSPLFYFTGIHVQMVL